MEQEKLSQTIGQNVFYYRKQARLTQEELAERTGLTTGTISKIERGTLAVMTITLYGIAEALHVTCDALIYAPGASSALKSIEHLLADQPAELISDIENIVRLCVTSFDHKTSS